MIDREKLREIAIRLGESTAEHQFKKRERRGSHNVEIHVDRTDLAAMLAAMFELGYEAGEKARTI